MQKIKQLFIGNIFVVVSFLVFQGFIYLKFRSFVSASGLDESAPGGSASPSDLSSYIDLGSAPLIVIVGLLFALWTVFLLVFSLVALPFIIKKAMNKFGLTVAIAQEVTSGLWLLILAYGWFKGGHLILAIRQELKTSMGSGLDELSQLALTLTTLVLVFFGLVVFNFALTLFLSDKARSEQNVFVFGGLKKKVKTRPVKPAKMLTNSEIKPGFKPLTVEDYYLLKQEAPIIQYWTLDKVFGGGLNPEGQGPFEEMPKFAKSRAQTIWMKNICVGVAIKADTAKDHVFLSPRAIEENFLDKIAEHVKAWRIDKYLND